MIEFALNSGAAVTAFLAAVFWFASAGEKVPKADKTFGGFLNTPDEIISALQYSARWNRTAAVFAGMSALFTSASMAWNLILC